MKKTLTTKTSGTICAFVAVVLSLLILNASAATVTYSGTVTPSTLGNNVATSLNQFDNSLGTLTGVQVTLDFSATPFASAFNATGSSQIFSSANSMYHSYDPSDIWTISYGTDSWNLAAPTVTTGTFTGSGQTIGSFSILDLVGSTPAAADLTGASGLDFSAYEGASTLVFGTAGPGFSSGTGPFFTGGTGFVGGGADLTGTASVTYTYIASVPEPTTLAMLGLGGLVLLLRKRQQTQAKSQ